MTYEQTVPNDEDEGGICVLCKVDFPTIGQFKSHLCRYAAAKAQAFIASKRLDCGCEPAWRCKRHARLVRNGEGADPVSEAVVNLVYADFRNGFDEVVRDTGGLGERGQRPSTGAGSTADFRNAGSDLGRPRQHGTNADRQRAYRDRKRRDSRDR